jgi:hypothetical protein
MIARLLDLIQPTRPAGRHRPGPGRTPVQQLWKDRDITPIGAPFTPAHVNHDDGQAPERPLRVPEYADPTGRNTGELATVGS